MSTIKDKWYHNIPYVPSKEERDKRFIELLEKAKRKAVRYSISKLSSKKTNKDIEDT